VRKKEEGGGTRGVGGKNTREGGTAEVNGVIFNEFGVFVETR